MATFEGPGQVEMPGSGKISDINFQNEGGLLASGGIGTEIRACRFSGGDMPIAIQKDSTGVMLIHGCHFLNNGTGIGASAAGWGNTLTVSDCFFYESMEEGIVLDLNFNGHVRIVNNHFFPVEGPAIDISNCWGGLVVEGNDIQGGAIHLDTVRQAVISDNEIYQAEGGDGVDSYAIVADGCDDLTISGNDIREPSHGGISLIDTEDFVISGNSIVQPERHGITTDSDCAHGVITGNLLSQCGLETDDTYDGLNISGDDISVLTNHIRPSGFGADTRYGINIVAGNDNVVYANNVGDSSEYGTADSVDNGTNTQTSPSSGVIGGQFAY